LIILKKKFEFPSRGFWIVAGKVGEADFFLEKLQESQGMYREFEYMLSAYVSAARSITFALQAVMSHYPDFSEWYKPHQEVLKKNDLAKYFVSLRNHLQKVGSTPLYHSGFMHNGVLEFNQSFIPIDDLKDSPKGDVIALAEQYLIDRSIPSPKISENRAVEYHAFFIRRKKKAQKETTAHARYNNHFTMFKPMC
jgi:hypothetical protein